MIKKVTKGTCGFLKYKKRTSVLFTILMFAVSLSLFFGGIVATDTKKNLLTVVAVLGILPASKSAVTAFMYLKAKVADIEWIKAHENLLEQCISCYDLVFTTYEKSYNVPYLVIRSGNVCGLTLDIKKDMKPLEKHIESCLVKEGHRVNVVVFDKEEAFLQRLEQLTQLEDKEPQNDLDIKRILFDITL